MDVGRRWHSITRGWETNMWWEWVVSTAVTVVIAVVGWVITWRKAVALDKKSRDDAGKESMKRDEDIRNVQEQLDALRKQAEALSMQAAIAKRAESIPKWSLRHVYGVVFEVVNDNPFTAQEVKVESVPGETEFTEDLGIIGPGSSQTFDFVLSATMACPETVQITWRSPDSHERSSVRKTVPSTRQ